MDWGTDLWVSLLHRHSYAFLLISVVWEKNICVKVNAAFEGKFWRPQLFFVNSPECAALMILSNKPLNKHSQFMWNVPLPRKTLALIWCSDLDYQNSGCCCPWPFIVFTWLEKTLLNHLLNHTCLSWNVCFDCRNTNHMWTSFSLFFWQCSWSLNHCRIIAIPGGHRTAFNPRKDYPLAPGPGL